MFPARMVVCLLFLLALVQWVVDPRLVYTFQSYSYRMVAWSWRSLAASLQVPGDAVEWAGTLLALPCRQGLAGAVVVTAVAWGLLASIVFTMRAIAGAPVRGTWIVPAVILTVLHGQYEYLLSTTLGLAVAVAMANLYVRLPLVRWAGRSAAFLVISAGLYYAVAGAYLVFVAVALVYELAARRRWAAGAICLVLAACVVVGTEWALAYFSIWPQTKLRLFPFLSYRYWPSIIGAAALYAYPPACAAVVVWRRGLGRLAGRLWRGIRRSNPAPNRAKDEHATAPPAGRGFVVAQGQVAAVIVAMALAGSLCLNKDHRIAVRMESLSLSGQWKEILNDARDVPPVRYTYLINFDVNLALYKSGRLPDEMFAYPQQFDVIPPMRIMQASTPLSRRMAEFYLELGRVNDAEAFAGLEYKPVFMKTLALTKIVKGQVQAARLVLNALADDPVYGQWARQWLRRLDEHPELCGQDRSSGAPAQAVEPSPMPSVPASRPAGEPATSDPQWEPVLHARSMMLPPERDDLNVVYRVTGDADEKALLNLLEANPSNRMAFEYLMALYLVRCDRESVARNLWRLEGFKDAQGRPWYKGVPRLYEQAVLMLEGPDGGTFARIGRPPSEGSRKLFDRFTEKYRPFFDEEARQRAQVEAKPLPQDQKENRLREIHAGTIARARQALRDEFRGSYFYYFVCGPEETK